ncbi:hypothetical protein ACFSR7_06255, partial [Cohnella sp. GCM10020058]|uniref:hypothetical protein n=1 Tax=Cohnella sp. GCM10020058 TaxID=3317330 RepID=UPI00362C267A
YDHRAVSGRRGAAAAPARPGVHGSAPYDHRAASGRGELQPRQRAQAFTDPRRTITAPSVAGGELQPRQRAQAFTDPRRTITAPSVAGGESATHHHNCVGRRVAGAVFFYLDLKLDLKNQKNVLLYKTRVLILIYKVKQRKPQAQ